MRKTNLFSDMERTPIESIQWDNIVQLIEEGKCVLCVGTEAYRGETQSVYAEVLGETLAQFSPTDAEAFEQEELLYFKHGDTQNDAYLQIARFYKEKHPITQPLLEKLMEIDFHLVINLSPDVWLKHIWESYEAQGVATQFAFYDKQKGTIGKIEQEPSRSNPVLYNLFGSVERSESLVFTHEDIFSYIFSMQEKGLPHNVKIAIKEARCFLFVGVQLDHWYIKILLQMLEFLNSKAIKYASALREPVNERFYKNLARFRFIEAQTAWVERLHEEAGKENLLRKVGKEMEKKTQKVELENMIDKADFFSFFKRMKELDIEDTTLSTLRKVFETEVQKTDVHFADRLKTYILGLNI